VPPHGLQRRGVAEPLWGGHAETVSRVHHPCIYALGDV
jgi:hypothetical protein